MEIKKEYIRKYWFGISAPEELAEVVLLMERDRIEQYKAALDITTNQFSGVFKGITGMVDGHRISIIYSIGPAHIADCVNFLAHGFKLKKLFSTGSVGGLHAQIGDLILSNSCATQDGFSIIQNRNQIRQNTSIGHFVEIDMSISFQVSKPTINQIKRNFNCGIRSGQMFTIPCVSLEDKSTLQEIKNLGYIALDLETGPFLAACKNNKVEGMCIHWVTDLPLEKDFYYKYHGDSEEVNQDQDKKHRQWLNMPKLVLPILLDLLN